MQASALLARNKNSRDRDDDDGDSRRRRKQARPDVMTRALEEKKERVGNALERLKDRVSGSYGVSERFLLEEAYRNAMDQSRDTGRIYSAGRTNPAFPQGAIVRSVKQHPKAWEKRGESTPEFKRVVPLGNKNCFDITPGEWLIQDFKWRVPNPKVKPGDTSLIVTSCTNGMHTRSKAQVVGLSTTANRVSVPEGDNHSNALIAGIGTYVFDSAGVMPAFATILLCLTPDSVVGDTPASMLPLVQEKGKPDDKFRVSVRALDERVVSAVCLRRRQKIDDLGRRITTGVAGADAAEFKAQMWGQMKQLSADELKGSELFPDDKPTAAYMAWYAIHRGVIHAIGQGWGIQACGIAEEIKRVRDQFKISREDERFVESHGGTLDTSAETKLTTLLGTDTQAIDAYFNQGLDKLIEAKLDHARQGMHNVLRRMIGGISLSWSSTGQENDVLAGMGGY